MTKADIRAAAKRQLAGLSDAESAQIMQSILVAVTDLPAWRKAKVVALTLAQGPELPTQLLIQVALQTGKTVVLPRVLPNRAMHFIRIDENTSYTRHKFGMLEPVDGQEIPPAEIDFVLVPGLVFDLDGNRLGFGGGYYDRWLPKTKAYKVGVVLDKVLQAGYSWPIEQFDVPVDQVVEIASDNQEGKMND
jgi:5-formyltetrahydrofolate cyclo-ligase